ncbi:hypothetical protein Tco_0723873, partial [Tanacetum coccineum]
MIDQALLRNYTNGDGSHSSHEDNRRNVTKGVVGLTRWIEKMESVFNISGCAIENQRNKGLGRVTSRSIAQDIIELANDLMDQKLRTYAERQSDNKRKADDSSRNNHGHQQQPFKRQNVAKAYNMGTGERKPYGGSLPKCTKCHLHHNGPCTQRRAMGQLPKEMVVDDGNSSGDDVDLEDEEEEEEHLAPANSAIVVPVDEPIFPPKGTEPVIPPPSTNITIRARITVRPQTSISLPPEVEVERLLAMTTPSPSPPISLSPPSAGERLVRSMAPPVHSSPPPVPSPLDHPFNIDLMPVELGSFDVIIGMDWLRR